MCLALTRLYAFNSKKPRIAAAAHSETNAPKMNAMMDLVWRGLGSGDAVHAAGVEISGVVDESAGTAVVL